MTGERRADTNGRAASKGNPAAKLIGAAKAGVQNAQETWQEKKQQAQAQAATRAAELAASRAELLAAGELSEYTVITTGTKPTDLTATLNEHAADGWRVKSVTAANDGSPNSEDSLTVVFERLARG